MALRAVRLPALVLLLAGCAATPTTDPSGACRRDCRTAEGFCALRCDPQPPFCLADCAREREDCAAACPAAAP